MSRHHPAPPLPDTPFVRSIARAIERFDDWMREKNWSPRTAMQYRNRLSFLVRFLVEREPDLVDVAQISRELIEAWAQSLYSRESERGGAPLMVATIRNNVTAAKSLFRFLHRAGEIRVDPAVFLEMPKQPKRIPRGVLSSKEMTKLLRSPDLSTVIGLKERAMLELLYSSGLRNAEIRALSLDDLDLSRGLVTVRHGKGNKDRVVPMGTAAAKYIEKWMRDGRPRVVEGGTEKTLFLSLNGRPVTGTDLSKLVQKAATRAGIKKHITPHSLRHTCATAMLRGRADIRHIQVLLGHESLNSTEIYTRVEIGDLKRVHQRTHPREVDAGVVPEPDPDNE